jgi:hypothetical protein
MCWLVEQTIKTNTVAPTTSDMMSNLSSPLAIEKNKMEWCGNEGAEKHKTIPQ